MLYLGCSQWNYYCWKGTLYPDKTKPKDYLHYYSKRFGCVELNSTFYDNLDDKTLSDWKLSVGPQFKFCPKFPKLISHERYLNNIQLPTDEFINSVKVLEENLGPCYLQLSPSMLSSNIYLIEELLTHVNNRIRISVEIRPEWLGRIYILKQCLEVLRQYKAGIVMVDGVETIEFLNNLKLTNSTAFIRFLAYNHHTDFDRINDWINLIKFWQDKGIKEVYFILHFADAPKEPPIIQYTIEKFVKELGLKTEDLNKEKLFL